MLTIETKELEISSKESWAIFVNFVYVKPIINGM